MGRSSGFFLGDEAATKDAVGREGGGKGAGVNRYFRGGVWRRRIFGTFISSICEIRVLVLVLYTTSRFLQFLSLILVDLLFYPLVHPCTISKIVHGMRTQSNKLWYTNLFDKSRCV